MSIFNCCTCPEPPDYDPEVDDPLDKYINTCGCPSVSVVCESSEKNATMCGVVDPDEETSPATFYTNKQTVGELDRYVDGPRITTTTYSRDDDGVCTNDSETSGSENCEGYVSGSSYYEKRIVTFTPDQSGLTGACDGTASAQPATLTATKTYSEEDGCDVSLETVAADANITIGTGCDTPCSSFEGDEFAGMTFTGSGSIPFSNRTGAGFWSGNINGSLTLDYSCFDPPGGTETLPNTFSVSLNSTPSVSFDDELDQSQGGTISEGTLYDEPDSEEAALDVATEVDGTSCSSLYQLRTTSSSFTKRTATYTATASNLAIGKAYEGCVRIRKREAYAGTPPAGADTEWEDVEPDTISSFTATDTEEEIAADVVVPNVQGYEYQVVSAHVWPVSVGCDCPTSYAP